MSSLVSIFGIRHHGPGSARRLIEALDHITPAIVLIEGPSDASHLLPMLADPGMVTPVALLAYPEDDPSKATFFPFAEYSPEYQAAIWAVRNQATVRFIDLPASDRLGMESTEDAKEQDPIRRDPIGALAEAGGYDDGESWWSDVIEENPTSEPVFAAVATAMAALREQAEPPDALESAREAHMRIEIAKAAKEAKGPVCVVCGAWHVPALSERRALASDRELLKGRAKTKTKATWAPWTAPRLASSSGYGAGVPAPAWYSHLWACRVNSGPSETTASWMTRISRLLRGRGHAVSTASSIEAQRLAYALAALRDRPAPGFAELREAAIACLCNGEAARWADIATELLIGSEVGALPPDTPLAPLLEDLQRQQKLTRLKPEALERALTLDLRSESGAARSVLLHRLLLLDIPWGRLTDMGRSRGTFRENWELRWEPEYAVRLVENLVYGPTIDQAASSRTIDAMRRDSPIDVLASQLHGAMAADLTEAVSFGTLTLETRLAATSDCQSLLAALPPMADIIRYGEARAGTAEHLTAMMPRIVTQAALALPYAARNLDHAAADALRKSIKAADTAIQLAQLGDELTTAWHDALNELIGDDQTTRLIAGTAARLLYEADQLDAERTTVFLSRNLSPGTAVSEAAGFFEGFFEGAGPRLIHDATLRDAVDSWLMTLEGEDFSAHLPLFRRVFSTLDRSERRHLMDALFGRRTAALAYRLVPGSAPAWPAQQHRILGILDAGRPK